MSPASVSPDAAPRGGHRILARVVQGPLERLGDLIDEHLAQRFGLGPEVLLLLRLSALLALVLLVAVVSAPLVRGLARRLQALGQEALAQVLRLLAPTLRLLALLLGLYFTVLWADPERSATGVFLASVLYILLVVLATRAAVRVGHVIIQAAFQRLTGLGRTLNGDVGEAESAARTNEGMQRLGRKGTTLLLWMGALALILGHFGQSVSSVITALGVTSLAIGLAAQQALANMIAGLVLLVDRPFRVGDRIRIPGLDIGRVEDLGMRSTRLRLADGNALIVPNTDLLSSRLVNYGGAQTARGEVRLQVPLSVDIRKLAGPLVDAARAQRQVLAEPAPQLLLLNVADKLDLSLTLHMTLDADSAAIEERLRREALRLLQELLPAPATATAAVPAAAPVAAPVPPAPTPLEVGMLVTGSRSVTPAPEPPKSAAKPVVEPTPKAAPAPARGPETSRPPRRPRGSR